jgi:hypothetical protein
VIADARQDARHGHLPLQYFPGPGRIAGGQTPAKKPRVNV